MNYEEFSPEAKAGIEQFRNWIKNVSKDKIICDGSFYYLVDNKEDDGRFLYSIVVDCAVLHGSSLKEGRKAADFAKVKNYWLD